MKDILLVGGAGGIGRAVALYLAQKGCRVFSADIADTHAQHENIVPVRIDIRSMDSVQQAHAIVKEMCEGLDAVISLAGVYIMDSLVEVSESEIARIMDINVLGVYRVNKVFVPLMRKGGRFIITTSELEGLRPFPFNGMYSMSKTALGCYADSLRLEVQLLGLKAIAIRPGAFDTQMVESTDAQMQQMVHTTALYKMGTKNFARIMHSQTGSARDPKLLAKVYYKAVMRKNPRLTYTKHASVMIKAYAMMPRRLQAFVIRAILK